MIKGFITGFIVASLVSIGLAQSKEYVAQYFAIQISVEANKLFNTKSDFCKSMEHNKNKFTYSNIDCGPVMFIGERKYLEWMYEKICWNDLGHCVMMRDLLTLSDPDFK